MSKKKEEFDYDAFEREALAKLRSGKGLIGEEGALTGLISRLMSAAFEGEIESHLAQSDQSGNRRNGYNKKSIVTSMGPVEVQTPRDRNGAYEPELIPKWSRSMAPELEQQVLHLYGMGTSYADISAHLKKMYGVSYSSTTLSRVTDRIHEELVAWKHRPLERVYPIIYLDAIHFKVREDRQVQTKAVYTILGVDINGNRDVLGIEIGQAEGARHWSRVLENIKERGVEDVIFFCVDGLKGLPEAIEHHYPKAIVQRCIVHMVRTSLKYVAYQDYKKVCKDLRKIYGSDTHELAQAELERFKQKWCAKYPNIAKKWEQNWDALSPMFDQPMHMRKAIYTTNAVEALHRTLRKVTKTKGAFVHNMALEKQLYLALSTNQRSWKRRVRNWTHMSREFQCRFQDRFTEQDLSA